MSSRSSAPFSLRAVTRRSWVCPCRSPFRISCQVRPSTNPTRRGPQGRVNRVLPDQRDAHMQRLLVVMQLEADPLQPKTFHFIGPQLCRWIQAVKENPSFGFLCHRPHQGVVVV